ncbi:MAG: c-type cytochrome biogenesis protein CcmI [Acetobacteraceae bacterium]|nr:c-type cytochrome biogenesis protein CcmI [Acetobacteraceae bacterium]MBV8524722.1 c-type cytochrome biogenesis protein CcmI [Acetobacteraceae bacterium]MBV8588577.1 c-type cytochrome biogenesis protein CcmI [Acetobacteraceae bacterium]
MIWLAILGLAAIALAPLVLSLRQDAVARGRREAALALHRAQLQELDRDLAEGRILPGEHAAAVLEVQRRLLAASEDTETAPAAASRSAVIAALVLVPIGAVVLYAVGGSPGLPAAPRAQRLAEIEAREAEENALLKQLRSQLSRLDPYSEQARQGYVLLGGAEASRRNMKAAAAAWRTALAARFDPTLAAETAEAITEAHGQVTEEAARLFRRALTEAPAEAPWRPMAEKRLAEAAK